MANSASDEINLMDVLAGFLSTLKRNLWLSILLPVGGLITGLIISLTSRDHYESSMLIETSLLSENECRFLFDQLEKLGTVPGLTKEEKKGLGKFSFRSYANGSENELTEKSLFIEMEAQVTDKSLFPILQKSLISVINEYPAVIRRRSEREKFYNQMIAKLDEEIKSMQTVKDQVSGNVQATYLNPADLYAHSVGLQREKIQYELRRDQVKVVQLLKGFDSLSKDVKPRLLFSAIIGFVVGSALLCTVLFLQFLIGYLNAYEKTH